MQKFLIIFMIGLCLSICGCQNFSPRQQDRFEKQNGRIGDVEELANANKLELGKIRNENSIRDSQLEDVQQGIANFQSNNSGIQILSGPGGLMIALVALVIAGVAAFHYRGEAQVQKKTAELMAQAIVEKQDPYLEEAVFRAAMYSGAERNVLDMIKKKRLG